MGIFKDVCVNRQIEVFNQVFEALKECDHVTDRMAATHATSIAMESAAYAIADEVDHAMTMREGK